MTDNLYTNVPPRSDDEIIAYITEENMQTILTYLPVDTGKRMVEKFGLSLKKDYVPAPRDPASVVAEIIDYLPFAWQKANDCRGLSAARSLSHMKAWLWMLREEKASEEIYEYYFYGKPLLAAISERFGVDWRALDNGRWVNCEDAPHCRIEVKKMPWRKKDALEEKRCLGGKKMKATKEELK